MLVFLLSVYQQPTHHLCIDYVDQLQFPTSFASSTLQSLGKYCLICPRYYLKSYDLTTRQFEQLRLVPYYATYSFSKLLCFAVGAHKMIRTSDPLLKRQLLLPTELCAHMTRCAVSYHWLLRTCVAMPLLLALPYSLAGLVVPQGLEPWTTRL